MVGDILSRMKLDIDDFQANLARAAGLTNKAMASIQRASVKASSTMMQGVKDFNRVGVPMMSRGLASVHRGFKKTYQGMSNVLSRFRRTNEETSRGFARDWWARFGNVSIGFTIAYRAMNALEAAIRGVFQSFVIGLKALDEFNMGVISIAASLQMLTEIPSKKSLQEYLRFGEVMFRKMEILAVRHFATGEQLQMAFTKMITLGIVPQTEKQLEAMAALVDRILMATRGLDAGRQIMTEIQAVIEGMQRPGAVVARELKSLVPHYKELIEAMGREPNIVKRTAMFFDAIVKPLEAVSSASGEIMKTMQAWIASLKTAGTIMLRAGLSTMYKDIVGYLDRIVKSLINENGLTERGIQLAYVYHASWEYVKEVMLDIRDLGVMIGAFYKSLTFNIPIISNFMWALHAGVISITFGLKSVLIMLDELKKSVSFIDVKPFSEYFEESFAELDKPSGSLLEYAKVNVLAWNKMYWAIVDSSKKANDEMAESSGTLLERIGARQEQLILEWNDALMGMKMPEDWFDPVKYEEFIKRIRETTVDQTKEMLEALAALRKGQAGDEEETEEEKMRRLRQILSLRIRMEKDFYIGRLARIQADADAEYDIRILRIRELTKVGKERDELEALAAKARAEKILAIHGSALDGMKRGFLEYLDTIKTFFEITRDFIKNIFTELETAIQTTMGDALYDAFTGQLKSIQDYYRAFALSFVKAWSNMISQVIVELIKLKIMKSILSAAGTGGLWGGIASALVSHKGGIIGETPFPARAVSADLFANAVRLHNGLAPDEFPAILQKGELVVPKDEAPFMQERSMQVDIVNVWDDVMFDRYLATSRGQDAIVNAIGARPQTFRRVLR